MDKKRCYIAGKIGTLTADVYEANFATARQEVEALGMKPICPTQLPHNHDRTWISYMREDLAALLTCDKVYAQRNWTNSKGAGIEVNTALALGIEVIYQSDCKTKEITPEMQIDLNENPY